MLFRLSEAGLLRQVIGPNVLRECEEVIRRKAPASLPVLAQLLATSQVETSDAPTPEHLALAQRLIDYAPDAHVLAEAIAAQPDWLVTHDKVYFMKDRDTLDLSFKLGNPGEFIQKFRNDLTQP